MDSNPLTGLIGFWMMMQLVATMALLLGGIYVLFCLGRAASGLDRMATAMEEWVARQNAPAPQSYQPPAPSTPAFPSSAPVATESAPRPEYSAPHETTR